MNAPTKQARETLAAKDLMVLEHRFALLRMDDITIRGMLQGYVLRVQSMDPVEYKYIMGLYPNYNVRY